MAYSNISTISGSENFDVGVPLGNNGRKLFIFDNAAAVFLVERL
jgi:hypothetical protein